ncbi:unnamed protein product, partial [Prorocentrum cordatum]
REAAGLVLLDRDEVIGSAAGPGERRLLQRRRKDRRRTTSTTADRGQSEDAAAAASQTGRTREDGHADRQRATDTITNECGDALHFAMLR